MKMTFAAKLMCSAAAAGIIAALLVPALQGKASQSKPVEEPVIGESRLPCVYYNDRDFKKSVSFAKHEDMGEKTAIGGIVPHHLLADSLIASFFECVSKSEPEVVFLIGPNHKRVGERKIHTGKWGWETPFGLLETDREAVELLADSCNAGEDFKLMKEEHSVTGLIPYVKYYLPRSKVVPVLVHGNLGIEGSKKLAEGIRSAAGSKKWIAIGSIDFSHYLSPEKADQMDEITLKAVKSRDLQALSRMGNDNLDSPPVIITIIELMNREKGVELKLLDHSNSARIAGTYSESTTSYFTMLYVK